MPAVLRNPAPVWLVGAMGSGKTVVGEALARRLGVPVVDNDVALEQEAGRSTLALADEGPEALHAAESAWLHQLVRSRPGACVAGVAASVGDRPDDLALLRRTGFVVYLRARVSTLVDRVGSGAGRPWLAGGAATYLTQVQRRRGPAYERAADLVIDVDSLTVEQVVDRIVEELDQPRVTRM